MKSKIAPCAIWLALACAWCLAQAPLLQLSPPQLVGPSWDVTVTNLYSQEATAFVMGMTSPDRRLAGDFPLERHIEDAVPSGGRPLGIPPGASKTLKMGTFKLSSVAYRVEAVIYADGATAGNPAMVGHLLQVRRSELDDIGQVLPILAKARRDPQLAADVPGLIQEFHSRDRLHAAALHSSQLHLSASDRVCSMVWANLQNPGPGESPLQMLGIVGSVLSKWADELTASKPALSSAASTLK